MSEPKFKAGDIVVRIGNSYAGAEVGKAYTIKAYRPNTDGVDLVELKYYDFSGRRFRKATKLERALR